MTDTGEDLQEMESFEEQEAKVTIQKAIGELTKFKEKENELKQDFVEYDSAKHISGPVRVENGTVPLNILELHHSYAYSCQRYFNLCIADPNTIIFASGSLIHFFDVNKNRITFQRGSTGKGIGHITKNPCFNHIAIGENGVNPVITIYEWSTMNIVKLLYGGTIKSYSHLSYSPDGLLLVSQGAAPDFLITIWDWQKASIILKCKSYSQDVYNVMFSPIVSGQLITSGLGHIKFWKICNTFTGLKLKGELGKFGKTEISDILGIYAMADEKVISGTQWGNILVWDNNLIKVEVLKKNKQTCHNKEITQFEFINGELISIGMDGWIRIWFYETIDQANPLEENGFLEVQPIYEFHIIEEVTKEFGDELVKLMCIQKREPDDPESTFWYAQDAGGGLWMIDLNTVTEPEHPRKILTCHAGPINDMDIAVWGPFVATIGNDGRLHMYNYTEKRLILSYRFHDIGTKLVWFPCKVDPTGTTLVCAFASGVIRVIIANVLMANMNNDINADYIRLIQVLKPHTKPITAMSLNTSCSLLVTGSEDSTIFTFCIDASKKHLIIVPIGYIKLPSSITYMTWNPYHETTLLIGCLRGDIAEVKLPIAPQSYTTISFELVQCKPLIFKFHSVKSSIQRELIRQDQEKRKQEKIEKKRKEMKQLMDVNPGIEIDAESFLMDSEEEPPLPEIYIPDIPNKILIAQYTDYETIWLSVAGFDAGYIYEYPIPKVCGIMQKEPIRSTMILEADNTEVQSCLYYKKKYLFLGMEHGEIRVCRIKSYNHSDFSDYWSLGMHDSYNGYIPKMLLSYDSRILLTCGHDGNLFSFEINDDTPSEPFHPQTVENLLSLPQNNVEDIEELDYPSLEEVIVKTEYNRIMESAKQKKKTVSEVLRKLATEYNRIMEMNNSLLKSQQVPYEDFELDPRITEDLNNRLMTEVNLIYEKLSFKMEKSKLGLQKLMDHFIKPLSCLPFAVHRILTPNTMVYSLREQKLEANFTDIYMEVIKYIDEQKETGRIIDKDVREIEKEESHEEGRLEKIEHFLETLDVSIIQSQRGAQINQMLRKYRAKKAVLEEREKQWKILYAKKPDISTDHPDDVATIEEAKRTVGDYVLKTSSNYDIMQDQPYTTLSKYKQILQYKQKLHYLREDFNTRLMAVRGKKQMLQLEVSELIKVLRKIHAELPSKYIKPLPNVFTLNIDIEYPEKNLELEKYMSMAEQVKEAKRQRQSFIVHQTFDPSDEEYEVLLLDEKILYDEEENSISTLTYGLEKKLEIQSAQIDKLQALHATDQIETAWEREMKHYRVTRKIYEQDCILDYIRTSYSELDKQLDELEQIRTEIVIESTYMELLLLTFHQELLILRQYEEIENTLKQKVNEKQNECNARKERIYALEVKIQQKNKEIIKLHEKIKNICTEYISMISENKFYDFLYKIFKKKYKPLKKEDESVTSSITSSETDLEEDEISIDSKEIEQLHFDDSTCPSGCDQELYNTAFLLREKRYEHEHLIKEEQKVIEILHKEIDSNINKLKIVDISLKESEKELQTVILEKRQKLNNINVTVILKLHQLEHVMDNENKVKIEECILFDKTKLSHLYARIQELQHETLNLQLTHKQNRMHLHKTKVDCKHMENKVKELRSEIKQEMMNKFGQEIALITLYEAVLHQMIYEVKIDLKEIMNSFDKQTKSVKDKYKQQLAILNELIQQNTEKLSFLNILEEEHLKLQKILEQYFLSNETMLQIELQYKNDIMKLEDIIKKQMQQKHLFQNDIRNLSYKSKPLSAIYLN